MDKPKLTRTQRDLLERIGRQDGKLLELQVISSGGRIYDVLSKLRTLGLVETCDHPTVKDRGASRDYPATALRLTESGKQAIL